MPRLAIYYPTTGKEALHQISNENGKRLINFAASRNMVIGTILFQHKEIHNISWRTPDAHHFSQIDHLLIDSRHVSHLMDVRSHRYADIDSDHFLILSRIRSRISNTKTFPGKSVEKYDYGKMIMLEKQDEYKQKLAEHLREFVVNSDDGLDGRWEEITCTSHKTAKEVFGKTNRKPSNDCFDEECQEATEEKNKAYVSMQQRGYTRASTDKYREARQKEKQVHKKKRKQYENNQIEKLEELGQQNQIRQFYRDINKLRNDFKPRLTICKSKSGNIVTGKGDILNRWNDYFYELLRKNRSTVNQIFTLRQILEKTKEFGTETQELFIDFKSAYDKIEREQLYSAMSEFNIPNKLIRIIRMTMENTKKPGQNSV
jgi:hypothetical protein